MTRRVRAGAVAALLAVAIATSGCDLIPGGSKETAAPIAPLTPTTPTPSPLLATPAPTVTPTPVATPSAQLSASKFEDREQVKVAREWAMMAARSINDGERDLGAAGSLMTSHGKDVLPGLFAAELGRYYPGPIPFTPTVVAVEGDRAAIAICLTAAGFSRVAGTTTTDARRVDSARITFTREGDAWKVDELQTRPGSCDDVTVEDLADPTFVEGGVPSATPAPSAPAPAPSASATTGISPSGSVRP